MGPSEQNIARQAYMIGQPMPERIAKAPELNLGLEMYLQAFFDLDSERSHGMGLTRIPWSSIADYAIAFEYDDEQTASLFHHIRSMDEENLKRLDEKLPKSK